MEQQNVQHNKTVVRVVVAALAVLMVLLIIALIINLVKLSAVNSRKQSLAEQNTRLEQLISDTENMTEICNSQEFIEQYAREMLDMKYRGETVIGVK